MVSFLDSAAESRMGVGGATAMESSDCHLDCNVEAVEFGGGGLVRRVVRDAGADDDASHVGKLKRDGESSPCIVGRSVGRRIPADKTLEQDDVCLANVTVGDFVVLHVSPGGELVRGIVGFIEDAIIEEFAAVHEA